MKDYVYGIIGTIIFLLFVGLIGGWESRYTRMAVCSGYNLSTNEYYFTDNTKNVWIWESKKHEDFMVGGAYRLIMDDSHTPTNINDDWIRKIKKR